MDNKVICTFCGEEYSAELSRCPECGEKNKNVVRKSDDYTDDIADTGDILDFDLDEVDDVADEDIDEYDDDEDEAPVRRRRDSNPDKIPVWLKTLILIVAGMAIIIAALFILYKMGMISIGKPSAPEPSASVSLPIDTSDPMDAVNSQKPEATPQNSLVVGDPNSSATPEPSAEIPPEATPAVSEEPVTEDPVETKPPVDCKSITVNRTDISFFSKGEVYVLNAVTEPGSAYDYVEWKSSDSKVAKVDSTGSVTAVNGGTANITAVCGDQTATCIVRCQFEAAEFMTMSSEDITLKTFGETAKLSVQDIDTADEAKLVWTSSDEKVATVDSTGKVTAVGKGSATIRASLDEKVAECVVRVNIASITTSDGTEVALEMNHTDVTLFTVGEYVQLEVKTENGSAVDASSLTWTSKDEGVCTVDSTGLVKAVGNGNTTVSTTVSGETVSCIVRVNLK